MAGRHFKEDSLILTCESFFVDTANFVVVQLKDAKIRKTRDTVCWNTGNGIVGQVSEIIEKLKS